MLWDATYFYYKWQIALDSIFYRIDIWSYFCSEFELNYYYGEFTGLIAKGAHSNKTQLVIKTTSTLNFTLDFIIQQSSKSSGERERAISISTMRTN